MIRYSFICSSVAAANINEMTIEHNDYKYKANLTQTFIKTQGYGMPM